MARRLPEVSRDAGSEMSWPGCPTHVRRGPRPLHLLSPHDWPSQFRRRGERLAGGRDERTARRRLRSVESATIGPLASAPWTVAQQRVRSFGAKAAIPEIDGVAADTELSSYRARRQSFGQQQHDAAAHHKPLRCGRHSHPAVERPAVLVRQHEPRCASGAPDDGGLRRIDGQSRRWLRDDAGHAIRLNDALRWKGANGRESPSPEMARRGAGQFVAERAVSAAAMRARRRRTSGGGTQS
jgi:hypothetical protein